MLSSLRTFAMLSAAFLSLPAFAAAVLETAAGSVRAGASAAAATNVSQGARIQPGTTVVTGPGSRTLLRFDDGQAILLNENSEFRVTAYTFVRDEPRRDSFVFELAKGALRSVSSLLSRSPGGYVLRTPQSTIGIRGTDFMVAVVNPAYLSVLSGAISATNAAGTVTFGAGTTATVSSSTTIATTIPASALPSQVAAAFNQMSSIVITASAAGATTATTAAAGGITGGVAAAIGAAIAGIAAAASGKDEASPGVVTQQPTGTTGTTGTR